MSKSIMHPFEFDSRMVEWNLKHSLITKEQLRTYLGSLPDEAHNAQVLEIEEDASVENGADHSGEEV